MLNISLFGFKPAAALAAVLLIASGLYFAGCSSNKEEKTGKTEQPAETEKVQGETPQAPEPTPAATEGPGQEVMKSHGPPPEITEPCNGLNEGDACTVAITGGREIEGTCVMTRTKVLGCMPKPRPGPVKERPHVTHPPVEGR